VGRSQPHQPSTHTHDAPRSPGGRRRLNRRVWRRSGKPAAMSKTTTQDHTFAGVTNVITYRVWPNPDGRHVVVLVHGYGEHLGRYEHVADFLAARGAVVAAPDHAGHGRSG